MIGLITNLDIYFSSACNQNCPYCCKKSIPQIDNTLIQQALADDSFVTHVKNYLTKDITSIGFWGLEPTINGQYFYPFIVALLNYSPYIRYIMLPTNGTSSTLVTDFIIPVVNYCNANKRKIKMIIQINLDGPKQIQNNHCPNTFDKIIETLKQIDIIPIKNYGKYFKLQLILKPTFTAADLTAIDPDEWQRFMRDHINESWGEMPRMLVPDPLGNLDYNHYKPNMEVPGNYTKQNGIDLCQWNIPFDTSQIYECAAGITSKTIDYQGNLYDCHMLCNKVKSIQDLRPDFENKMNQLVAAGEVIEQDRDKLFNAISSIYCWATGNEEIPESYIKLLGNGAIL